MNKDYQPPADPLSKGEAVSESAGRYLEMFCDAGAYPSDALALTPLALDEMSPEQFHFYNTALMAYADITRLTSELSRLRERERVLVEALDEIAGHTWDDTSEKVAREALAAHAALEAKP